MGKREEHLKTFEGNSYFWLGDEACAYGALFGGCSFFAGYPITPASEVAEVIATHLPRVGGYYVQMEDEIASIAAMIGSVWAGARAMTATSGPGFSLMQENIGYAIMTETPCVIVDVQRSGPSTGQATKPAQGDVMQARWGTHGDHNIIALAPNSVQECFDMMIDCFNLSEEYRTPVIFLMDGEVGHLRERITVPSLKSVKLTKRRKGKKKDMLFGGEMIPPMKEFGDGYFLHVTGSTHKEDGIRDVESQKVHEKLVTRIYDKIDKNRNKLVNLEEKWLDDAKTAVISYGAAARPAKGAVAQLRKKGKKVGFMRLRTIWPFPREQVRALGKKVKKIYVPEMNLGQLSREIERFVGVPVVSVPKIGGIVHNVNEIIAAMEKK
jgi:2-oxoglutarate ferredoxin oxidoreductase subunit alpha